MGEFGDNLRREREARGVSIEDIALGTRIGRHHLQALETGDLGRLPGGAFNRGFVRAYARYLGMDPEVILTDYLQEEKAQGLAPPENPQEVLREMARLAELRGGQEGETGTSRPAVRRLAWAAAGLFVLLTAWMARGWIFDGPPDDPGSAATGQSAAGADEATTARPIEAPEPVSSEPPAATQVADSGSPGSSVASEATSPPVKPLHREPVARPIDQPPSPVSGPVSSGRSSSEPAVTRPAEGPSAVTARGTAPGSTPASPVVTSAPARPAPPPAAAPSPAPGRETVATTPARREPAAPAPSARAMASGSLKVSDYGVGSGISGKQLTGRGSRFPEGSPVWFWTHLLGARPGEVVEHVWLRNGSEVAKVNLTIGSSSWRAYSKKTMYPGSSGTWVVMARTESGEILALSEFTCD